MSFVYPHINLIALAAAAVAQFVLGFLWYAQVTPIGRAWAKEMKIDAEGQAGAEMLVFPVGSILAAWAVAVVVGWSGASGAAQGVLAAWVVALAVAAQVVAAGVANSQSSVKLVLINVGYLAVGYAIMGAIVGSLG